MSCAGYVIVSTEDCTKTVEITTTQVVNVITEGPQGAIGATGPAGAAATYSNATPQPLGTADPGIANSASRADHVHTMPSASDVGATSIGLAAGLSIALG